MKTRNAIRLLLVGVSLLTVSARAQTYKTDFVTKIVMAGSTTDPANALTLRAGANVAPITITFPDTLGAAGYSLGTDGTGKLVWSSPFALASQSVTGDVTMSDAGVTSLSLTGITAGQYGDATHVSQVTFDAKGRATSATSVPISLNPGGVNLTSGNIIVGNASNVGASVAMTGDATIATTGAISLANTAVTAGSYGDATHVGTFTVDGKGRLTSATSVQITGAAPTGAAGGDLNGNYPNPNVIAVQTTAGSSIATAINASTSNAINGENVLHTASLAVDGTHHLELNTANANTWTGRQTFGAIALTQAAGFALSAGTNDNVDLSVASSLLRVTAGGGAATITGVANPVSGRVIVIVNADASNPVSIVSEASTGTAANRFHIPGGSAILMPDGTATFIYDGTLLRWRMISDF